MINKFYYLALFFLFTYTGLSQTIFLNEITDSYPSAVNPYINNQYVDANITVSGIGRGINITAPSAAQFVGQCDEVYRKRACHLSCDDDWPTRGSCQVAF